jgi:hypothetical protein
MTNWGSVAVGLIIIGAIFYLPIVPGTFQSYSVGNAAGLCASPLAALGISSGTCQYIQLIYYCGLIIGVAFLIGGFLTLSSHKS